MLGVSPLRSNRDDEIQGEDMETLSIIGASEEGDFAELWESSVNFDDLFSGDGLPDLEMDPDIFFDFSFSGNDNSPVVLNGNNKLQDNDHDSGSGDCDKSASSDSGSSRVEEIMSKRDGNVVVNPSPNNNNKGVHKGRNKSSLSSYQSKNPHQQTKKKVKKVDWNPELHRRFVEAVEQLGVDKAVPSKILEIMAIDGLTRHNIASHLQKYRSHRKHLLAREAEATNRSQGRQMHGAGGREKREVRLVSPWVAPTIGFPPTPMPLHFRTLHVWGHPTMKIWPPNPGQLPPPAPWPSHPHFPRGHQNAVPPGTPCFSQPLTTSRFGSPPTTTVAGIPPGAICKVDHGMSKPLVDSHPLKESIDAAIGDVLSKPWLPLPLGLKAPAIECVMGELQRQGIPNIPT